MPVLPTPDRSPTGWCGEAHRTRSRPRKHLKTRDRERGADGIRPSMRQCGRDDRARSEGSVVPDLLNDLRTLTLERRTPAAQRKRCDRSDGNPSTGGFELSSDAKLCLGCDGRQNARSLVDQPQSRWSVLWLDDEASDPDLRQRQLVRKRLETIALRARRRRAPTPGSWLWRGRSPLRARAPRARLGESSSSRTRRCASRRPSSRSDPGVLDRTTGSGNVRPSPGNGRPVDGPTDTSTASRAFVMPCFCHMAYRSPRLLVPTPAASPWVGDHPVLRPKEECWPTISSSKDSRGEPSMRALAASAGHLQSRRRSSRARPVSSARMWCGRCSTAGAGLSVWTCAASSRRDGSFSPATSPTCRSRSGPLQTSRGSTT